MGQNSQKVKDIMASAQSVKADDPELIEKLTLIAQKVAEAQGKKPTKTASQANIAADPMDELGCEGCQ